MSEARHRAQVITIASQKGGTGKTSTAAALTQAAAAEGLRALAIDLDPQGNLSFIMGADANRAGGYELITGQAAAAQVVQMVNGCSVITASRNYTTLTTTAGSARRLERALRPIAGGYDLIVIDTPPTGQELLLNALMASTGVIVTTEATALGLQGLYLIGDVIRAVKQQGNPGLACKGIVYTRHSGRSTIARQMQSTITAQAEAIGLPTLGTIREAVALREAQALQANLYSYAPNSKPAQDYREILRKLMEG